MPKPIYLDYAATTPCDPTVIEAMHPFFFEQFGNASSPHSFGRNARKAVETSREILASFIGAQPTEIIFTAGASESNNHAILSTAQAFGHKGRHIIASAIEHHSVIVPLQLLARNGYQVTLIKPESNGIINPADFISAMTHETILVCLHHANNEIGTLQPVEEIGLACRERKIPFLVDATQTVGHIPVNVQALNCDFLSLSAHKFYGPQGVGALYNRRGIDIPALILGGDQERGRRAATHNLAGIVGMGEALNLCRKNMAHEAHVQILLRDQIIQDALNIPGSQLNGDHQSRLPNNAHFSFDSINGEELITALDMSGIAVSMGSACTWGELQPSHVLKAIGLSDRLALGSLRVSLGRWTTKDDVTYFLEQLRAKVTNLKSN